MDPNQPTIRKKRAAIWYTSDGERRAVATLTLTNENGDILAKVDTAVVEHRDALAAQFCLRRADDPVPNLDLDEGAQVSGREFALTDAFAKLERALEGSGYELVEIPDRDFQLSLNHDLSSGRVVGTVDWLNPARASSSLPRDLASRMSDLLPRMSKQALAAIESASGSGDLKTVLQAIRSAPPLLPDDWGKVGDILEMFEPDTLEYDDKKTFHEYLARGSVEVPTRLERALDVLIGPCAASIEAEQLASYRLARAMAIARQGNVETALRLWRELVASEGREFPRVRAGALIATAKTLEISDPEAVRLARMAADAFLECGSREQSARALVYCCRCLLHVDVRRGMAVLREAENLFALDGAADRHTRATLLWLRATMHFDMGMFGDALRDVRMGIGLLEGLLQVDGFRHEMLVLGIDTARAAKDVEASAELQRELGALRSEAPEYPIRSNDVSSLLRNYDPDVAERVVSRSLSEGDEAAPAMMRLMRCSVDKSLSPADRLRECERAVLELESSPRLKDRELALLALAEELVAQDEFSRAALVFARLLTINPVLHVARQKYGSLLLKTRAWRELASFAAGEVEKFGVAPGRLLLHGRAILELGDPNGALRKLQLARKLAQPGTDLFVEIDRWRDEALARGADGIGPEAVPVAQEAVTISDLRARVSEFARFIANEKRHLFWRVEHRKHHWTSSPERHAKSELHTFLKASFNEGIETLEEVSAGAGRIDLYAILAGGSRVVIELKMCGHGYSTTYALEGIEQISHYMTNKRTSAGLLVVFDGRVRDFGKGLNEVERAGDGTIYSYFVDVRHSVKSKE